MGGEAPHPRERRRFGELEHDVLGVLWAADRPLKPAEVQAALSDELAYTTVMTILVRLTEKGVIKRARTGRAYAYKPVVAEGDVIADEVRRLLDRGKDRTAVLQRLVEELEPGDEDVLTQLLDEATRRRAASRADG
jgi:predicted transcriptional regulator